MEIEYDIRKLKENLREKWIDSGLTQKELAKEIGITEKTLNKILNPDSVKDNGEPTIPDLETIIKLCNRFKCDIDALFGILDYSKHDHKFICEFTGLSDTAVYNLHNLNRHPQTQIIDWFLTGSRILDHIEQYVSISNQTANDILFSPQFTDNIKILGVDITAPVLKQAIINMIQNDLELCDRVLTLDWDDQIDDTQETVLPFK